MKRNVYTIMAFLPVVLICLIMSVGASEKKKALPRDHHEAAGITCGECHSEEPAEEAVATPVCLSCHKDYARPDEDMVNGKPNPHTAHPNQGFGQCNVCHHEHKASEDGCKPCHDLGYNTP